jgi:hypothetical protein
MRRILRAEVAPVSSIASTSVNIMLSKIKA